MINGLRSPLRVMSLHAGGYCRRLFYLEEVEEIRVANDRVYAGARRLHVSLAADRGWGAPPAELADPALGLVGKVDAIRRRDGALIPYEHKRGKARRDGKVPDAWPSDRLQVIAYAALIESATGQGIAEGRVRYHADNVTVRVPIDAQARADLDEAIATAASPPADAGALRRRERAALRAVLARARVPPRRGPPVRKPRP